MNTIEQIVSTHTCPIIREKIMGNLTSATLPKQISNKIIDVIDYFSWGKSNEGYDFWNGVFDGIYYNKESTYSDLKHLDNSYTHEPTPPTPKWLPIDKDNLPDFEVIAMKQGDTKPYIGFLFKYEGAMGCKHILVGSSGNKVAGLTHYISLTDLLNLPISE